MPRLPEPARLLAALVVGLAIGIAFEATSNVVWTDHISLPHHGVCGDVLRHVGLIPQGGRHSYIHHVPRPPPFPFDASSPEAPRVHFADAGDVYVLCYPTPSEPGTDGRPVMALEDASPADFDYLGLDRLDPPSTRLESQSDEDALCRRMSRLGAKPWDSLDRFATLMDLLSGRGDADQLAMMKRGRLDAPGPAERSWKSACVDKGGRQWMAKLERVIPGLEGDDGGADKRTTSLLRQRARLRLAATMPEKCRILKHHMGAFMYESDEDVAK